MYHHLGKLNFEAVSSKGTIVSIIVHVDRDFKEFSVLRVGPVKHQRRLCLYAMTASIVFEVLAVWCSINWMQLGTLCE